MNYYEHHIGDFAEATAHLTFVEDAAYSRMIRKYYATEKPMPADVKAVQRLVGARSKEEREAVESVLHEFFVLEEDGWHQKRCDADLQRYLTKQDKARASANARWSKPHTERNANASETHMRTEFERNAIASQTHDERNALQSPDTSPQSPSLIPLHLTVESPRPAEREPDIDLIGHQQTSQNPAPVPDCPHREILDLWAEVMPDMPQHDPDMWTGSTRADHLRARWRATAALKGWTTKEEGLRYFRKLFGWCRSSQFLMGKSQSRDRRPFELELAWLINATNWTKVHEGKFHG